MKELKNQGITYTIERVLISSDANAPCPENHVFTIAYDRELGDHDVLIDNLDFVKEHAYELFECKKKRAEIEFNIQKAVFDVEKKPLLDIKTTINSEIYRLEKLVNHNISPFEWKIQAPWESSKNDGLCDAEFTIVLERNDDDE